MKISITLSPGLQFLCVKISQQTAGTYLSPSPFVHNELDHDHSRSRYYITQLSAAKQTMGVFGLTRHIKSLGLDENASAAVEIKEGSTLCIDGDGLIFHLFKLGFRKHYANIVSADQSNLLQSQLLLPLFTPLSLIHDIATSYLSDLTLKHGLNLQIYFDGPDQFMKSRQRGRRQQRRNEEWENVRQLCIHGIMPETGPAKSRSAARRQARTQQSSDVAADDDAEFFLSSFPFGKLAFHQIRQSIREFAHNISSVLFRGSVQLIYCNGEADVEVARNASATSAYCIGNDTDYFIYGTTGKDIKYICLDQLKPSEETLRGIVHTRGEVSTRIGLSDEEAMIELSIILGNDYTGPLLRHDHLSTQKKYWSSLRWQRDGEQETLPNELNNELRDIIHHVGERVEEGWRLTSTMEELKLAIEYSYALYSFESTESFRSHVNSLDVDVGDNVEQVNVTEEMFPAFPKRLDEYVTSTSGSGFDVETDLFEAITSPLTLYMSEVDDYYVEETHLDSLKLVFEAKQLQTHNEMELPRHQFHWKDIQAVFILEKLMLRVICASSGAHVMPHEFFDHLLFFSYLESISLDDSPLIDVPVNREEDITNIVPEHKPGKKVVLPIDKHEKEILNAIKSQRVTIIHGETGCGKSSRVPCFLLRAEPPQPSLAAPEVKMIISQPRRIAAKALAERVRNVEPDLAHKIALRMGHGMKEFESHKTRAWFVTTGYVVRLLANHPHWFDSHTHLIIDEVHERSVDSDILCLLCRRLLHSHPTIRLVLMSATLAADLYSQYFGSPPPIHVGVRRFPINEYFVEDLASQLSLSTKHSQFAQDVFDFCRKSKCSTAPPDTIKDKSFHLASQITASVGEHGSSVLIFVAGMSDIENISELIERLNVHNVTFTCFPIHSDIPFEEQMEAFEPPKEGEVKVVIATNAAESSVTLDVDHVICLGLCKQIVYNKASHRQQLIPTWISRASATQRAGRTGRVRSGNVYRLYSRDAYNEYFAPFEAGEILRSPLDSVILSLRDMLNEPVTKILLECLEAPDITTIERSFQSLHASNFISRPDDEGEITSLGELVVALGIDLKLGALVGLGIQFGIPAESIELAGILSFPKEPWAISSPMYHDSATFNELGELMMCRFYHYKFSIIKHSLVFLQCQTLSHHDVILTQVCIPNLWQYRTFCLTTAKQERKISSAGLTAFQGYGCGTYLQLLRISAAESLNVLMSALSFWK
jgi:superfamily II DNA/RNA helicase